MITKHSLLALGFFSNFQYKAPLAVCFTSISYLLTGDFKSLYVIGILVLIDFVTGVMKALKKRNFTSVSFSKTGVKVLLYLLLLITAHQVVQLRFYPEWTDELIEGYIAAVELYSILENAALLGFLPAKSIIGKLNIELEKNGIKNVSRS